MHFDLSELIKSVGYIGLFAIVFAESGLLIGFFLPGDSLLFTAGFLASLGYFEIHTLLTLLSIAAITGDSVGYWFGKKTGKKIFNREDSMFFHKKHLESANAFYRKHGGKTIVLARFMPAVRTFAPIVAGAAEMEYRQFVMYNILGGLLWVWGLGYGGYYLGKVIPNVDTYLIPVVIGIVIVSVLPGVYHMLQDPEHRKELKKIFDKIKKRLISK